MNVRIAALLGETASGHLPTHISEVTTGLTREELDILVEKLRRTKTPQRIPPGSGTGVWRLESVRAFAAKFAPGLSIRELAAAGKLIIIGDRWHRLYSVIARYRMIVPGSPRGIAARNALRMQCVHGHELSGDNLRLNKLGHRVCRQCTRDNAARSKEKSKKKRAVLIGPSSKRPRALSGPDLDKRMYGA